VRAQDTTQVGATRTDTTRADTTRADTAHADALSAGEGVGMTYRRQLRLRRRMAQRQPVRDTAASTQADGVALGGMVINETISTIGRNFYDVFYSRWEAPSEASNFTVRIAEQYAPSLGSQVVVRVDETAIFRSYLQPNFAEIRKAALRALARTERYLKRQYQPREVY
jgi:hypothetical protein